MRAAAECLTDCVPFGVVARVASYSAQRHAPKAQCHFGVRADVLQPQGVLAGNRNKVRDVVYYADVEGLRYPQIAAIMNTPTATVASQLHRGRRHLRRLLGDGVGGAGTETMSATATP